MKNPKSPPNWREIMLKVSPERMMEIFTGAEAPSVKSRYVHWEKLRYLKPPSDLTHEEWWLSVKMGRSRLYKEISLRDTDGKPLQFLVTDPIPEQLHNIDLGAGGKIGVPVQIINHETRDEYYLSSLMEEAITSSQLEGATTTRQVAKEMIRAARPPKDRSERMILNNFQTMQRISKLKNEPLSKELVFEIHRLVTNDTLDNPDASGRFRRQDENVVVGDNYGEVFHIPPPALELANRMQEMCKFANSETPHYFLHPVMRSIILHFWLAYDHPFVDGNGRTARALFYWSMLHYGFWLCEFLSISHIILNAPVKYGKAFLYTETDDNDLTYFIIYHIEVLKQALDELNRYIEIKTRRLMAVERELHAAIQLNHRQRALISHALRHPHFLYTTEGHRLSHNLSYQTARNDLMALLAEGMLTMRKSGKTSYFSPSPNLEALIKAGA